MSSNIVGLLPFFMGLLLSLYSHRVMLSKLTPKSLEEENATLGLFALRATLYLLTGGLALAVIGTVSLVGFLPWA